MLSHSRCNLFAGMGMGKTLMGLTMVDTLHLASIESDPTLVVAPLRVARDGWPTEVLKWDHLKNLRVIPIIGTEKHRQQMLRQNAEVFTINYEMLPWLVEYLGDAWPFKTVIADESTKLKGYRLKQGGKRAQALGSIAHSKVNRWVNLSGTPAPNGLKDLWGQMWFIDQGVRLGRSYSAFQNRWFYRDPNGGQFAPLRAHRHAQKEIQDLIKDVSLTLDPADWFNLQEPIFNKIEVILPAAQRKQYKQLEQEMFVELLSGSEVEAMNAAVLTGKCLQYANGALYTETGYEEVHKLKLEALESIMNEQTGMPLLVQYNFVSDRERILKTFKNAADLSTTKGMKAFRAGDIQLGIAHPKSMGHGIDGLQDVTNILVRYGHDWNLEERMQMLERIGPVRQAQSGHKRPTIVYDLIAKDTIDEIVLERHTSKRRVQDLLLEAMK